MSIHTRVPEYLSYMSSKTLRTPHVMILIDIVTSCVRTKEFYDIQLLLKSTSVSYLRCKKCARSFSSSVTCLLYLSEWNSKLIRS